MIVTSVDAPSLVGAGEPGGRSESCLARRGMLHSECEAVDHLRVPAGTRVDLAAGPGRETAWFVVSGAAELEPAGHPAGAAGMTGGGPPEPARPGSAPPRAVADGDLLLVPEGCRVSLLAAPGRRPLELLRLTVLTSASTTLLPERTPVA